MDVCVCVLVDAYLVDTNTHVITHLSIISVKISIDQSQKAMKKRCDVVMFALVSKCYNKSLCMSSDEDLGVHTLRQGF